MDTLFATRGECILIYSTPSLPFPFPPLMTLELATEAAKGRRGRAFAMAPHSSYSVYTHTHIGRLLRRCRRLTALAVQIRGMRCVCARLSLSLSPLSPLSLSPSSPFSLYSCMLHFCCCCSPVAKGIECVCKLQEEEERKVSLLD